MNHKHNNLIFLILVLILVLSFSIANAQLPPDTWQPNEIGIFYFSGLAQHDYLNVDWIRTAIPWCILQPDSVSWDWYRFENRIQQAINAGVKVLLTLRIGQGWMNRMPLSEEETYSLPPTDLSETWDEEVGYSPSYFNFIFEVVNHFHPAAINIENEANANNFYQGSVEEYIRILKTAKLAAQKADPDTRVMDSGFACRAWGITVGWDRYQSGRWNQQETFDFLLDYAFHWAEVLQNPEQLDEFFQNGQDHIDFIVNAIPLFKDNIDLLNFHSYADYSLIDTVIVWIREKMNDAGYQAPLFCNEHGIKIHPDSAYARGGLDQAKDIFKQVITMWATGVEATLRFPFEKKDTGTVGLFTHPDSLRLAAQTLQLLGRKMSGRCRFSEAISSGPEIFQYAFVDSAGGKALEAAWCETGECEVEIQIPQGIQRIYPIDVIGNKTELEVTGEYITITLDTMPILIEFIQTQTYVTTNQQITLPISPILYPPFPNPFNSSTTVRYYLPRREYVTIKVLDILGREVVTLIRKKCDPGHHVFRFNAQNSPSGMYLIHFKTTTSTRSKTIELVK